MRKLSPLKAILHALNSVWSYRRVATRISMPWAPVMLACGLAEIYAGPIDPMAEEITPGVLVQLVTSLVALIAFSSLAVSWNRFILRDEMTRGLRLDGNVARYAGNTLLMTMSMVFPLVLLIVGIHLTSTAVPLALVAMALIGGSITRLSIKLPAVALANRDFTFRQAWEASTGNFWACVGVFLISGTIMMSSLFVLLAVSSALGQANETLADAVTLVLAVALQLVYAIFNASVMTSLYGFFVEQRDF